MKNIRNCSRWLVVLLMALAFLAFSPASGSLASDQVVTSQDAYRAALAWLNLSPDFFNHDPSITHTPSESVNVIRDSTGSYTLAYVLTLAPRGFIVITPSFDLNPVIAYSADSIFNPTDTPENILLHFLRSDISGRLWALDAGKVDRLSQLNAHAQWGVYLSLVDVSGTVQLENAPSTPQWDVEHGPFLASTWDQSTDGFGNPTFNLYTPNNYVSGCVSTAMAQILYHYQWPLTGTGSHSYFWDNGMDPPQTLSADFGGTTYDWANTQDDYFYVSSTLPQRQAAGLITYHAGVAVDMNYADGGSGASLNSVDDAFKNYFRMSGEYMNNTGDFYTRLYDNILHHRPVTIGISGAGGHAVVVDGVRHDNSGDTTRFYHLNMGWSGFNNGWYDLNATFVGFTSVDNAIFDIVPTPDMQDPGTITSNSTFPVTWAISPNQGTCIYELQQIHFPPSLSSFLDGAETGIGNWDVEGYWEQSSNQGNNGSTYSFHGQVLRNSIWFFPGTFTLNDAVLIDSSTTLSYYWGTHYGQAQKLRLEISSDGSSWTTLRTHIDESSAFGWNLETVSTGDLAAYVGGQVYLRFVVDYIYGESAYGLDYAGFYVDDFTINNAHFGSWVTLDDAITTNSKIVTVSQNGEFGYRARANCSDWYEWSDFEVITITGLTNDVFIPLVIQ